MEDFNHIENGQIDNIRTTTNIPCDHSSITDDTSASRRADQILTVEGKKRKFDEVYSSRRWQEEDKYEVQKVKQIVRNNIFKHLKFVKGEGVKNPNSKIEGQNRKCIIKEYGKCHEKADLTKVTGYAYNVMELAGVTEKNCSITERALYWKTYNCYVREEVRQMRGRMSASIKHAVSQGE